MYEENRKFNWTDLFIKVIIAIIFILFTVWLLSLSVKNATNGLSDSLNVLTDNIFSQNVERMKEVGKEYFTTERLPQKIGEIKTLTLEEMYKKSLILEIKDKNGKTCSSKNSYVAVEKMENEYQMKVYLECGEQKDFIIVIMGCYNYCNTDICEKKQEIAPIKNIEYEYSKTTGGKWGEYGAWSEWSRVEVTNTNNRQVETKVETEKYSYDKVISKNVYEQMNIACPSGYSLTQDGTKCYKVDTKTEYADLTCPSTYNGYSLVGRDGTTCKYSKSSTTTTNSVCPSKEGYTVTVNGFTCNYSKTETYTYQEKVSQTCYKQEIVMSCTNTCAPVVQNRPYDCSYYETKTGNRTLTESGNASCPAGYTNVNNTCVKNVTETTTQGATCPTGYTKGSNNCYKTTSVTSYTDKIMSCPTDYKATQDGSKCFKTVDETVQVIGTRNITLYRYRIREYVGGTVDYKWSSSNNDKNLINAGYKLTGKTREVK